MNRGWYAQGDCFIGKYKAIRNRITKETALVGRYGQIWQWDDKVGVVVVVSARVATMHLPPNEAPVIKGDEACHKFPMSELSKWARVIKIYTQRAAQIEWVERQFCDAQ